jgi:hypothetical protein|tara:strand:- start:28116 stop:28436 length:321 start_codon:yes stop_codon:yes gene_type:complete
MIKKLLPVFIISFLVIAAILFLFPINLFDGEIIYESGLQVATVKAPLSLSYFIGMGYDSADLVGVKSFRLLPVGYLIAFLILFGLPALVSYRIYLGRMKKDTNEKN